MKCTEARRLFDPYLDGDLSPSLAAELDAHRLRCADCRRAFALMEVSGHLLASDSDPTTLKFEFTDRLLSCMEEQSNRGWRRWVRWGYVAGPLAAAAVIALAFLGVFDGRSETRVAGVQVVPEHVPGSLFDKSASRSVPAAPTAESAAGFETQQLEAWFQRMEENLRTPREPGDSLQRALDLTILQLLDILERAREGDDASTRPAGAPLPAETGPKRPVPVEPGDVEDL